MKQKTFNYSITSNSDVENFFVSKSNKQAYEFSLSNNIAVRTPVIGKSKCTGIILLTE